MIDFIASADGFAPLILLSPLLLAMIVAGIYLAILNQRKKAAAPSPASAGNDLFASFETGNKGARFRVIKAPLIRRRGYNPKARARDPEGHTAQ